MCSTQEMTPIGALLQAAPQQQQPPLCEAVLISTCLSDVLDKNAKKPPQKNSSAISLRFVLLFTVVNHNVCAKSSLHLAQTGRNTQRCIFIRANVLNGQRVLFCTFDRCNPQRFRLVDQLAHLFARDIKLTHVFTHENLQ